MICWCCHTSCEINPSSDTLSNENGQISNPERIIVWSIINYHPKSIKPSTSSYRSRHYKFIILTNFNPQIYRQTTSLESLKSPKLLYPLHPEICKLMRSSIIETRDTRGNLMLVKYVSSWRGWRGHISNQEHKFSKPATLCFRSLPSTTT